MPELKPCPFCGSDAGINEYPSSGTYYAIECKKCCATSGLSYAAGRKGAIDRWNTRAPDPRTEELLSALEKIATGKIKGEPRNYRDALNICKSIAQQALDNYREVKQSNETRI